jgi:hypothetical protein
MGQLKNSLNNKLNIKPSKNFDIIFFEKLAKEQARPKTFSIRRPWLITGLATATALFIFITNYNVPPRHTFNHKEYIDTMLEFQNSANDGLADDRMIDLTTIASDEIYSS